MEIAAVIFVLVMIGIAYVAFRILKRTIKLAMRALIVLLILAIAGTGGIVLWNMDFASKDKPASSKKSR